MFKIIVSLFFVAFLLKINTEKLSGIEYDNAVKVLNATLLKLENVTGNLYTAREVKSAFKFIPDEVYSYEATLSDDTNDRKKCTITVTYSTGVYDALAVINCEGDRTVAETIDNDVNIGIIP
ncbi:uncharacterized protein LOC119615596 [Lucilia sericata]|uniref:uncharacterized protein LOC119615596 n=1 Tax=Lucilia sericata TaxID=13632 RepID=UPI0018A87D1C|nr:uncharacterized protein LOC119615596 [Lucilia sericata]